MKYLLIYSFLALGLVATAQKYTGCPKLPVDPCTCGGDGQIYLSCDKVDETEVLRNVFRNSASTWYFRVHITNSVLQYVPYNLFDNVIVTELQLSNVTLVQLFDEIPQSMATLKHLHLENMYIFRGILWEHLEPMTSLRILNIYYNRIEILGNEFTQYAPKSLEQITFYKTRTSEIKPGVFGNFPLLTKVAIDHCKLTELRRNMFPVPFNGSVLYFNDNLLTTLPEDLFTDMPNLQTVGLRGNSIGTLPPAMFRFRIKSLEYFILEGNPLYCDCNFKWLSRHKPSVLKGTCFSPPSLHGRNLADLSPDELYCLKK